MKEEVDIKKIIKDLAGNFGSDNEAQMKGVQLLKGLATSDDPLSNKFMKALNQATTKISKSLSENVILRKEMIINKNIILEAGDEIEILKEYNDSKI